MKTYYFPYGGSSGKHDTWDSIIDVELTDEEAERLEASAKAEERWRLDEDPELQDIYDKVYDMIFDENKRMMKDDGRLKERRDDWENSHRNYYDEDEDPDDFQEFDADVPTDDDLVDEELGSISISYPEELQCLFQEDPE